MFPSQQQEQEQEQQSFILDLWAEFAVKKVYIFDPIIY